MCLGVSGQITEVKKKPKLPLACFDFGVFTRDVCLGGVRGAAAGGHCLEHVGVALDLLSEAAATQTRSLLAQIAEFGLGTHKEAVGFGAEGQGSLSPAYQGCGA